LSSKLLESILIHHHEACFYIWDCENSKGPGPNGIKFMFIMDLWDVVKKYFLAFFDELHINGRLEKVVSSSFIVLLPEKRKPSVYGG